jgi:oligogalacturonide transporter
LLVKEIARLRDGGSKNDVDPQTKKLCETLTGHPYETLWKKG